MKIEWDLRHTAFDLGNGYLIELRLGVQPNDMVAIYKRVPGSHPYELLGGLGAPAEAADLLERAAAKIRELGALRDVSQNGSVSKPGNGGDSGNLLT